MTTKHHRQSMLVVRSMSVITTTAVAAMAAFAARSLTSCHAFAFGVPSIVPSRSTSISLTLTRRPIQSRGSALSMSESPGNNDNNSDDDDGRTNVDSMRSLLESSWNVGTMGEVPTSPESAAEAASEAIGAALTQGKKKLMQVDIRLPAFDITQGPNIYDEILSVEFCCQLVDNMSRDGKCQRALILVKDGSAVRSAARILDVKERRRKEEEEEKKREKEKEKEALRMDEENDEDDEDDDDEIAAAGDAGNNPTDGSDDIDAFRKQLISGWGGEDSETADEQQQQQQQQKQPTSDSSSTASAARRRRGKEELKPSVNFRTDDAAAASRPYRLGSLFGDDTISTGADMFTDAIEAVDTHGTMLSNEDVLVILSPVSREDTVAVRRLISRYKDTKTIVLVNNRLSPEPKELFLSEPVYSITPLVAKKARSAFDELGGGEDSEEAQDESAPTKIIVMRRYPGDWQIFIDVDGEGFELVDSAPAVTVDKTGPDNEWISGCVKRHMAFKFGQF